LKEIDTLYSHGSCASYGEIRRYLTSIAHHEIEQITGGVYVPDGIIPIQGTSASSVAPLKDLLSRSQQIHFERNSGIRSVEAVSEASPADGYSSVTMVIFSMSCFKIRAAECAS
jgi:hypothetical protein